MNNTTFASVVAAGLTALSLALAAPAPAANDVPFIPPYGPSAPQGAPQSSVPAGATPAGAPADQVPATSPGANPFVPLGPGH